MQQVTTSLCNVCYAEIPAVADPFNESVPMLYKACTTHGMQRAALESDKEFYTRFNTYDRKHHYKVLIINVTDRCNIQCPHCFYPIKNQWDMSLEDFQGAVGHYREHFDGFILSGGDPTCWAHYLEAARWCNEQKIMLSQLTNGVKMADPEFFNSMASEFVHGDILCAEMSIHPVGYNTPTVRAAQLEVLVRLRERGLKTTCVMMNIDPKQCSSLETDNIMDGVIDFMREWRDVVATFRIRPICFGWATTRKPILYLSHLVKSLRRGCEAKGITLEYSYKKDIDNIYNQNFLMDGIDVVTVCAAPTVENIDIGYLNRGPWMLANDGRAYSVPHCLIVNEGIDKGWYQGRRIDG